MNKYTIKLNRRRKTYTIRRYDARGKLTAKFRSYPQGREFSEDWTENDIRAFLKYSNEYYEVRRH
jgi:hypothetical protein